MTIAVGTEVEVSIDCYPAHLGKDLYVMFVETFMDKAIGYGVGPAGNDPEKRHSTNGWLYYNAKHITPAPPTKESNTLTTFTKVEPTVKAGDRVTVKGYSDNGTLFEGQTGTVEHTYPKSTDSTSARVQFDDAKVPDGTFDFKYLVPAPRQRGEFSIGDKVRVKGERYTDAAWIGVEGIIEGMPTGQSGNAKVKLTTATKPGGWNPQDVGYVARINLSALELVEEPKPFTYADIQAGDTIKRTRTHKSGTVETREGTVVKQSSGEDYWHDGGTILAYKSDDSMGEVTYELVNRPEPEPEPKLTDGTVKGDQIVVKNSAGHTKVYTRQENDRWTTLVFSAGTGGTPHRGFEWSTSTVDMNVKNAQTATLIKA